MTSLAIRAGTITFTSPTLNSTVLFDVAMPSANYIVLFEHPNALIASEPFVTLKTAAGFRANIGIAVNATINWTVLQIDNQ